MGSKIFLNDGWQIAIVILIAWNLFTFFLMGVDKHRAQHNRWRIPEARLLGAALAGGALGVFLGMKIFHHKMKHPKFTIGIPLFLMFNLLLFYGLWKISLVA